MYESHFHLNQAPFSIAPDPAFLYLSSAHREAMAHLMYGFSHGGFVMVTGEVGTGKTTLLRNLLKQTPPELDVAFILNPRLTVRELLATLCDELGIPYDVASTTTVKQYIDLITRHLLQTHRAGRSTVMIIDEAQNLSPAVLEQVRLLTNLETDERKLLRIILIGQPELTELLDRQELRQLAQRITARYHLGSLDRADSYAYVMHRMSRAGGNPQTFTQGALRKLYSLSKGIPRVINVIADRALLGAYTVGAERVNGRIVSQAAKEVLGRKSAKRKWWLSAAAAIAVAIAAWVTLAPGGGLAPAATPETEAKTKPETEEDSASRSNSDPIADPDGTKPLVTQPGTRSEVIQDSIETAETAGSTEKRILAETPTAASDPVPQAIEQTEDGDSVITPESYALLQAEQNATSSRSLPRSPRPPPTAANGVSPIAMNSVERPTGSAFGNRRRAYGAIFERWGVDYVSQDSSQIPCDFAPSAGLQCLSERGDWGEIASLDLPVVLELSDGRTAPYHAALVGLSEDTVTLQLADQVVEITQQAIDNQWSGAYVVLWQTPPGYYGSIREGQNHETVGWLRQQLAALVDRSLSSPRPNHFDQDLQDAVIEFQAEEGLLTDGVVGPATWIRLAARLELPQPSLAG